MSGSCYGYGVIGERSELTRLVLLSTPLEILVGLGCAFTKCSFQPRDVLSNDLRPGTDDLRLITGNDKPLGRENVFSYYDGFRFSRAGATAQ